MIRTHSQDLPTGDAAELLRRVQLLELAARRNVASILEGDYPTAIKGSGLLFEEPRRYMPGDPVRSIDWNITARVQEPHVRVYREERQREVVLAVDVSPSMHSGFQERTKLETAVEVAATLAVSATDAGDRLGWILFADHVLETRPPRHGKLQLWRALRALLAGTVPWERRVPMTDPREAIHDLERTRNGPLVLFLISDCVDRDLADDLRYLRSRHDASLVHIYDPFEFASAGDVTLPGVSPEGDQTVSSIVPGRYTSLEETQRSLALTCARLALPLVSISTANDVPAALIELFHRKRSRSVT